MLNFLDYFHDLNSILSSKVPSVQGRFQIWNFKMAS